MTVSNPNTTELLTNLLTNPLGWAVITLGIITYIAACLGPWKISSQIAKKQERNRILSLYLHSPDIFAQELAEERAEMLAHEIETKEQTLEKVTYQLKKLQKRQQKLSSLRSTAA